jgi:hypothetical protein
MKTSELRVAMAEAARRVEAEPLPVDTWGPVLALAAYEPVRRLLGIVHFMAADRVVLPLAQAPLARALGISQPQVSALIRVGIYHGVLERVRPACHERNRCAEYLYEPGGHRPRTVRATIPGACPRCHLQINVGDEIVPGLHPGPWEHQECPVAASPSSPSEAPRGPGARVLDFRPSSNPPQTATQPGEAR